MISAKGSSLRIINDRRINLFSLFGPLVWPTRVTVERFLLFVHIPRLRKDTKALPHLGGGGGDLILSVAPSSSASLKRCVAGRID